MADFDFDYIWAKSDGKSLLCHLQDCLQVYQDIVRALPVIPALTQADHFFDWLFCAVYMHDWGKAHREFQKVLKGCENHWCHNRHELFSAPFTYMLPFPSTVSELIARAILSHHKDFETLQEYLYSDDEIEMYALSSPTEVNPLDFKCNLLKKLDIPYLKALKTRFQEFYNTYALGDEQFTFKAIHFAEQAHPIETYINPYLTSSSANNSTKDYWRQMFLSGALKLCDHIGSAEIEGIQCLSASHFDFLNAFDGRWYAHQKQCADVAGNLVLTAPTGSGKTEAALLWARKQFSDGHQGRIFYILPYTASINAMHRRLVKVFEKECITPAQARYVGVLHGKLTQYLAEYFEYSTDDAPKKEARIKQIKKLHRQMVHPLKVITPFQILKYFFGVKGFEKGLTELAGAMLIFDEIHAYETRTFAQITASLEYMRKHLGIRVMIMTATLPSFMLKELFQSVGAAAHARASDTLMKNFTKHRVRILDGTIVDRFQAISKELEKGKRVIVVCNTVANAQTVYRALAKAIPAGASVLIHSRFTAEDRFAKEKQLFENADDILLLVGTQAIEVSLDIDFDVMFTEPAPLDALIQRFGRINRNRKKGICPVYVCRQGGTNDSYIYKTELVKKTLDVLENITEIKEKNIQNMIDQVYSDWSDQAEYNQIKDSFADSLTRLKPLMRHKESEDEFYKQFNGTPVIPSVFQDEYQNRLQRFEFIKADRLFVSLHQNTFFKLLNKGLIEKSGVAVQKKGRMRSLSNWMINCPYDSRYGLIDTNFQQDDKVIKGNTIQNSTISF